MDYREDSVQIVEFPPERPRGSGCIRSAVIGLIMLGVVVTLVPLVVQKVVDHNLGPAGVAQVNEIKTKPLTVPPDWLEAKPYPPDLRQIMHDWMAEYETSSSLFSTEEISKAANFGITYTEDQLTSVSLQIDKLRPAIQYARQLADHPAYDMDIAQSPELEVYSPKAGGLSSLAYLTKLLLADARVLNQRGDCAGSLEHAVTVLHLSKRHPASTVITHSMAISMQNNAAQAIISLGSDCDDTSAIQNTVDQMNRFAPEVKQHALENPALLDQLGMLRHFKREGFPVRLENGRPLAFHIDQFFAALAQFPNWKLQNLSPSDPYALKRRAYLHKVIAENNQVRPNRGLFQWGMNRRAAKDLFYSIAIPSFEDANVRSQVVQARYDLARLSLAKRLAVLQGADDTTATAELLVKQMGTTDAFDTASLIRVSENAEFYSIGPDLRDDGARIVYDVKNDTRSAGDIVLRSH